MQLPTAPIRNHHPRWKAAASTSAVVALALGTYWPAVPNASASTVRNKGSNGVSFTYGYYGNAVELNVYKKIISLYESTHPGVKISATYDAPSQFLAKLPVLLRAGTQPDVVNIAESWVSLLQSTFHDFINLGPYIKKAGIKKSNFVVGTWTPGALDGEQLMLPNVVYGDAVAVNETLFKKYHVPLPSANWTAAQLLADAKKVTHGSGSAKIWGIAAPLGPQNIAQLFGGQLFNYKTNQMTATSPLAKKAITWMVDLVQKYKVTPKTSISYGSTGGGLVNPFLTGHAAMDITYASYDQQSYAQSIGNKFQWTLVPFPKNLDGVLQLNATSIFKGPRNPSRQYPAEFDFIKWLSTNLAALKLQGQLSSPAYKPALQQWLAHPPADWQGVNRSASIAALARSPFDYDGQAYTEVWTMFANEVTSMIEGSTSIATGIKSVQSQGNSDLGALRGP